MKDTIYQQPMTEPAQFVFDEKVAQVFPDMVKRSVPGYSNVIAGTGLVAADYVQPATRCYDLGCSIGASTFAMLDTITETNYEIIAVDNSEQMITQCHRNIANAAAQTRVTTICEDIQNIDITEASVVVLNYTLQFIPVEERPALLEKIHAGMVDGGVLILSEKLAFDKETEQIRQTALHESFKRAQGYTELEISQKRAALENVLIPETRDIHIDRLHSCGFREAQMWFRSINFASFLAWK